MATIVDHGGRLLLLGLLIFFLVQVIFSANKLRDEKTAVSTRKQYDQSRLMPSFSFCFPYPKIQLSQLSQQDITTISTGGSGALAEATLNDARQVCTRHLSNDVRL